MTSDVDDAELHAFVDGDLPDNRRAAVEAMLADDPDLRERVEAYRRQNRTLHALFDPVLDEPVPARLVPWSQRRLRARRARRRVVGVAAAAVLALASGVGGWTLNDVLDARPIPPAASLISEASRAHRMYVAERRHAVEVGAQEDHLFRWLSDRLGTDVEAPDFGAIGFTLMGGRLLPSAEGPAAQYMYENAEGDRLTLYIRRNRESGETTFHYSHEDGVGALYWIEGGYGCALIGPVEREPLLRAAEIAYAELVESWQLDGTP